MHLVSSSEGTSNNKVLHVQAFQGHFSGVV